MSAVTSNTVEKAPISLCEPERLAKVSLMCCDMDGTWLSPEHRPTDGGVKAIMEAEAVGVIFCFATGRCPLSAAQASCMPSILEKPGIYSNGAMVLGRGGKKLYSLNLPKDVVNKVVNLVVEQQVNKKCEGVAVLLNDCNDFFIAVHGKEDFSQHLHRVYHDPKPIDLPVASTGCFPLTQLIHVVGSPEEIDVLFPLLQDVVGKLGAASIARNLPTDLTVTSPDAHKGFAVGKLKEHLRDEGMIPPADAEEGGLVICIGDSGNDVTMLSSAGDISVAMANARRETLEAAEFYTVHTNGDKTCPGVLETAVAVAGAKRAKKNE
jgi:hydroxymethylpyrimidine pyrophosphatase-like HAD family hydrolase